MPILPLDHPEPFAATLGVMLYPGSDEQGEARAFVMPWLAVPLQRFHDAGYRLSYEALARMAMDAGAELSDVEERWWAGTATGELFKVLFILAKDHPALASWQHAIMIYKDIAKREGSRGCRTNLWREKKRFLSVLHLWGAWSIRQGIFRHCPELGYDGAADFQCFLTEAEILRDFGQSWRPSRAKSKPPLPLDVFCVPPDWKPPIRQPGWPNTGMIPDLKLHDEVLARLRPPGRPRRG